MLAFVMMAALIAAPLAVAAAAAPAKAHACCVRISPDGHCRTAAVVCCREAPSNPAPVPATAPGPHTKSAGLVAPAPPTFAPLAAAPAARSWRDVVHRDAHAAPPPLYLLHLVFIV